MECLLQAGRSAFTEMKNLVVWNKKNGGLGTFYRSKYELIFVFKQGKAEHTNTFRLGEGGRYARPGEAVVARRALLARPAHKKQPKPRLPADPTARDCGR